MMDRESLDREQKLGEGPTKWDTVGGRMCCDHERKVLRRDR